MDKFEDNFDVFKKVTTYVDVKDFLQSMNSLSKI